MATSAWTNDTSCIDGSCYKMNGYLDFVPTFGSDGLLIALGGCSSSSSVFGTCKDSPPNNFSIIDVYHPSQQRWYTQTASNGPGQLPEPREGFCGVGLPGDNGTYEIFIYAGGVYSTDPTEGTNVQDYLDAVYVLSLPAFVWHKANYPPTRARAKHSCNIVGKRQMLAVGGVNSAGNIWLPKDPWTQGLNVFDLTEMRWTGKYDAEAENYVTPAVVKSWYKDNGMYPRWDNPELQKLFTVNAPSPPASNPSSQPSPIPSTTGNDEARSPSPGVIAGAVIGSLCAFIILIVLAFFLLRRRRRSSRPLNSSPGSVEKPAWSELPSDTIIGAKKPYSGFAELGSGFKLPPQEIDAGHRRVEAQNPQSQRHQQISELG